jgi:hypothetical protein
MYKSGLMELEAVVAIARLGSFRAAALDLDMSPILEQVNYACAGQCCINRKVGRGTDAYNERTARVHPHGLSASFEFPGCHRATCDPTAQARVI